MNISEWFTTSTINGQDDLQKSFVRLAITARGPVQFWPAAHVWQRTAVADEWCIKGHYLFTLREQHVLTLPFIFGNRISTPDLNKLCLQTTGGALPSLVIGDASSMAGNYQSSVTIAGHALDIEADTVEMIRTKYSTSASMGAVWGFRLWSFDE